MHQRCADAECSVCVFGRMHTQFCSLLSIKLLPPFGLQNNVCRLQFTNKEGPLPLALGCSPPLHALPSVTHLHAEKRQDVKIERPVGPWLHGLSWDEGQHPCPQRECCADQQPPLQIKTPNAPSTPDNGEGGVSETASKLSSSCNPVISVSLSGGFSLFKWCLTIQVSEGYMRTRFAMITRFSR